MVQKTPTAQKIYAKRFAALSDTELLSILIRSGTQDNSALVVARKCCVTYLYLLIFKNCQLRVL